MVKSEILETKADVVPKFEEVSQDNPYGGGEEKAPLYPELGQEKKEFD
jgi:hypothetical protein